MGRRVALTTEQVQFIRSSKRTLRDLADELKVSLVTVFKAKHGKPPYHEGDYVQEQESVLILEDSALV